MQESNNLIRETIEILQGFRVEVHGDVEDSALHQLDEAILKLEEADRERPNRIDNQMLLELLSEGIGLLPIFIELMKFFHDQC